MKIDGLNEKIEEAGGISEQCVGYDLGYRRVTDTEILLHHNDVLKLMVALLEYPKFRRIFAARFPVLFIDEYQDTDKAFAESLIRNFVDTKEGPLIGLFGDSWPKIYGNGVGLIQHDNLQLIGKKANFRSVTNVVNILNRIRPDLPQEVSDPAATGSAKVLHHSNNFGGKLAELAITGLVISNLTMLHDYLTTLRDQLTASGWDVLTTEDEESDAHT